MKYKKYNEKDTCLIDILIDINYPNFIKNEEKWDNLYKHKYITFGDLVSLLDFDRVDFFFSVPIDNKDCLINCLKKMIKNINKKNVNWIFIGYNSNLGHAYLWDEKSQEFYDNLGNKLNLTDYKKFLITTLVGISFKEN